MHTSGKGSGCSGCLSCLGVGSSKLKSDEGMRVISHIPVEDNKSKDLLFNLNFHPFSEVLLLDLSHTRSQQ